MNVALVGEAWHQIAAVVAISDRNKFERFCRPGLERAGVLRWCLVEEAESITDAYNAGQQALGNRIKGILYIHEDAKLLCGPAGIVAGAMRAADDLLHIGGGLAGAMGSVEADRLPWAANRSAVWARGCEPMPAGAGISASRPEHVRLLDGLVLLEVRGDFPNRHRPWTDLPGWHGYDAQRCLEANKLGLPIIVHPGLAVRHHAPPGKKPTSYHIAHVAACTELARTWGLECTMGGQEMLK